MTGKAGNLLAGSVAALLGLSSIVAPVLILGGRRYPSPLFPWIRSGVEGFSSLSALFLFLTGVVVGLVWRKRPLFVGLCSMAAFPVLAFLEMLADGTSHNLWPLEFIMYAVLGLIAVAGAYVGRWIGGRFYPDPDPPQPPVL